MRNVETVMKLFGIYILVAAPFVLVYNVVDICYWIKCRKKRGILSPSCRDVTCRWRKHCDQYEEPLTHEDVEALRRKVDAWAMNLAPPARSTEERSDEAPEGGRTKAEP